MSSFNVDITLEVKTCPRGHCYAIPHWVPDANYQCPMCAQSNINQRIFDAVESRNLINKQDKQISSLRGVITRMKKRK
jgi:hypothetical protein